MHVLKSGNIRDREFGIGLGILDLDSLALDESAASSRSSVWFGRNRTLDHVLVLIRRITVTRHVLKSSRPVSPVRVFDDLSIPEFLRRAAEMIADYDISLGQANDISGILVLQEANLAERA
jgi:hypothetical protein